MKYKIFLLEDVIEERDKIMMTFEEESRVYQEEDIHFSIEHLPGAGEVISDKDGEHLFYQDQEHFITELENKINKVQNEDVRVGLLLDIILTEYEHEEASISFYPKPDLAKKIYTRFNDRVAVYFVTSIMYFETRSEMIMGEDVSDKFISKKVLIDYKYKNNIKDMFNYFISYQPKQK